jgi:polyisoprenoid-binding protein YceI
MATTTATAATDTTSATATAAAPTTWRLDAAHSAVTFTVRHMMFTTVKGHFARVTGQLRLDEEDMTRSVVSVALDAASIDTRIEARDNHLRSADFLDVANHPELRFTSRRVERGSGERLRVIGDLTIRGVTREVVIEAALEGRGVDPDGEIRIGFTGETRIDRTAFGLVWNQALEAGGVLVGEEVRIQLEVQAVAERAG